MNDSKHVYLTLDGLRGIAALAVVMIHIEPALGGTILPHAYLAVDMFFLMSGLVIAHAYEHRLKAGMKPMAFMRLRLIRLYPIYILGTAITLLGIATALTADVKVGEWTPENLVRAVVPSLFMLPSYVAGLPRAYPLNPPAWSLFFELVANFVYVLLFPRLTNRVLIVLAGAAALCLAALSVAHSSLNIGVYWETFYGGVPRVFWSFPLGILLYRTRDRLPRPSIPPVFLGITTLAIFAPGFAGWYGPAWDLLAVLILLPAVCIAAISNEPRRGGRLFLWLGVISYPIYGLHEGLFKIFERPFHMVSGQPIVQWAPWAGILFMIFAAGTATVMDKVYDRPVRRFLSQRSAKRPLRDTAVKDSCLLP